MNKVRVILIIGIIISVALLMFNVGRQFEINKVKQDTYEAYGKSEIHQGIRCFTEEGSAILDQYYPKNAH